MYSFILLEKGMETHSRILAWRIPWTGEPGGLQSLGSQRVIHHLGSQTVVYHRVTKYGTEHSFILLLTAFGFFPGVGFNEQWYYEHSWTHLLTWLCTHWCQGWDHVYIHHQFSQIRPNSLPKACTDLHLLPPVLWVSSHCSVSAPALSEVSLSTLAVVVPR